jgi:hypothetical protein
MSDEQQQAETSGLEYSNIPLNPNAIREEVTTEVLKQYRRVTQTKRDVCGCNGVYEFSNKARIDTRASI